MILTKNVHIQCEDLMMLRFSNTKSSMLFKILSVDEAPQFELDKLLDNQKFKVYYVRVEVVRIFTGLS